MADNYTANAGTGLTFAADLIGGALYPRVKMTTGADGAATDVSATDPMPVVSGAVDDSLGTIPLWLLGDVVLDLPEDYAVLNRKYGMPRITARRAVIQAPDVKTLEFYFGVPVPDYSDIVGFGGAVLSGTDLALADTDPHYFFIPMAISQWRRLTISVFWKRNGPFDRAVTCSLYGASTLTTDTFALLATATITATNDYPFTIGEGAVGQGGVAGGSSVANNAHYSVPAMNAGWPYVVLKLIAVSDAPSTGSVDIILTRMST